MDFHRGCLILKGVSFPQERANKASRTITGMICTRRWGAHLHCTERSAVQVSRGAIPNIFLRLNFFPVGRRSAARPSGASPQKACGAYANRWAFPFCSHEHFQ